MLTAEPAPPGAMPLRAEAMIDMEVAIADLEQNLQAYEAIQQIVTADALRTESHLPTLRRDSLSALLGVLNSSLRQRCGAARVAMARVDQAIQRTQQALDAQSKLFPDA